MRRYVFLSIKEEYAFRILDGSKTIELRKSRPKVSQGDYAIIYCTSPMKAIIGIARIKEVIEHTPMQMWRLHSKSLGITKDDFFNYYKDTRKAIGLVLYDTITFSKRIDLKLIKENHPTFTPPQTYKYFTNFLEIRSDNTFSLV